MNFCFGDLINGRIGHIVLERTRTAVQTSPFALSHTKLELCCDLQSLCVFCSVFQHFLVFRCSKHLHTIQHDTGSREDSQLQLPLQLLVVQVRLPILAKRVMRCMRELISKLLIVDLQLIYEDIVGLTVQLQRLIGPFQVSNQAWLRAWVLSCGRELLQLALQRLVGMFQISNDAACVLSMPCCSGRELVHIILQGHHKIMTVPLQRHVYSDCLLNINEPIMSLSTASTPGNGGLVKSQ